MPIMNLMLGDMQDGALFLVFLIKGPMEPQGPLFVPESFSTVSKFRDPEGNLPWAGILRIPEIR